MRLRWWRTCTICMIRKGKWISVGVAQARQFYSSYGIWSSVFCITQRPVISQRQVLFTIALRRQMFLFADIMWAQREREVWHQLWDRWLSVLGWNPGFRVQAADRRGPWLYLRLSWAQTPRTRHSKECLATPCCSSSLTACNGDGVHFNPGKYRAHAAGQRKSTCQTGSPLSGDMRWQRATVSYLLYSIHPLKLSLLLLLSHLTVWALMPPCVQKADYTTRVTWSWAYRWPHK